MKRLFAILAVASVFVSATPIGATSWSTDQSDLYYIPNESGWGAELVQRGPVVVATIYVYAPTTAPIWYNAALTPTGAPNAWTGDLYVYSGPWFGTVPFNPAAVQSRKVGSMTWVSQTVDAGVLTYTVDGVTVTKNIQRASLAVDDYTGAYVGNVHSMATGCANPADNGTTEGPATIVVVQNGSNLIMDIAASAGTCTFVGPITQAGQFGEVTGTASCTTGDSGTFQMSEMIVGVNYLAGNIVVNDNHLCHNDGYFAAIRHRP